jgi:hypothetical protein
MTPAEEHAYLALTQRMLANQAGFEDMAPPGLVAGARWRDWRRQVRWDAPSGAAPSAPM